MIKIDDFIKAGTPLGIAIGIGASVFAASVIPVLPAVAKAARPGARAAIKSGILLAERGREIMAEVREELEDIFAEVKAELLEENNMNPPESTGCTEDPTHQNDL